MAKTSSRKRGVMTVEEAGRKGGMATKAQYGPEFYSRIGKKGGQRSRRQKNQKQSK